MLRKYEKKYRQKFRTFVSFRNFVAGSGFSLIEAIIGLAIIILTITIFGGVLNTLPLTKHARNQNLAYHLAAKKIEELRNTPFSSLPPGGSFTDPGFSDLASGSGSLTVANYSGSGSIKQLTVTISWSEGASSKNLTLETLMSDKGLNQP